MKLTKRMVLSGVLVSALLLAGCRTPSDKPTPTPTPPVEIVTETPPTLTPEPSPTGAPISEQDIQAALKQAEAFLAGLSTGEYRNVYGTLLTTNGQEKLADLVLGRLALANPHISYFELLGAEPLDGRVAANVIWRESSDEQGEVGTQQAKILLARQGDQFLVDEVELGEYLAAATPAPPPLPRAEALTSSATVGQEMRFRVTGFQADETILTWLELPDGNLLDATLSQTDANGAFETAYPGEQTATLQSGRWIWWAQALRDSSRNTGITFEVAAVPTVVPTDTPVPTATAVPTTAPVRVTAVPTPTRPAAAVPTATSAPVAVVPPTATPVPQPSGYPAPTLIWPEPETSRDYNSALIVEFVPVTGALAANEWYQLTVIGRNGGQVYNGGSVQGKGDACDGFRSTPCVKLIANERFLSGFFLTGMDGTGSWYIQVVRQTGPETYEPISPPSEVRTVKFNHR